ncbi:MAG: hypothetical protein ACFE8C_10620 [Promethearchaeota archaeon]
MPENNEKVEDFISLWRKKMESENDKPSVIGETLEKIKEVEKENEKLRKKIKDNIELISKTEKMVKATIEENERLKEQLKQGEISGGINVSDIQKNNVDLNNKIISLEKELIEKEVELRSKSNEITELKTKLEATSKSLSKPNAEKDSEVASALIGDLKSDLTKKKIHIVELEEKINELTEENEALNQQLIEKLKKLPIDYTVPVEQPKPSVIKPQATKPSSQTLEILCQDLQNDLNKYKRIVEKLNEEKSELEHTLEIGGFNIEPKEIKELKKENEELKDELSQLQESLKNKQKEAEIAPQMSEVEEKIKNLQVELQEKDQLITELKTSQQIRPVVHKGPMSDLIEDLQSRINKLKSTIEEKNKIIEELKSS